MIFLVAIDQESHLKILNDIMTIFSDKDNIKPLGKLLEKLGAKEVKVLEMSQGQKISRVLAWKF